jgi:hypothetical protein
MVQRWPAGVGVRVGPRAGDKSAMPAQQGVGLDEEAGPASPRQDAADGGEQGAVGEFQLGPWGLATQDGELVTEDEHLKVLGGIAAGEQGEELNGSAQREIGEFR